MHLFGIEAVLSLYDLAGRVDWSHEDVASMNFQYDDENSNSRGTVCRTGNTP